MTFDSHMHRSNVCFPPLSAVQSGGASSEGIHLGPIKEGSSADSFLLPEDLVHLTRRSLFLIIDSDNSTSFSKLQVRAGWVRGRVVGPVRRGGQA
jgi:hypothetical protein